MELLDRVAAAISARRLLGPDETAVVAVSGGADSLTLLDLLARLRPLHRWHLHVATFDHRWGAHGAAAVEAVRAAAAAWGLPFHTATAAVVTTDEEGARRQRWQFLDSVALSVGAVAIAVGHTAEDRAETLLLNLLRGAGTTGLGAMGAGGRVIRPLLDLSRAEVRAYAAEARLAVHDDPTNADPRWLRNRLRGDVLPRLEALRPGAAAALARAGRVCEEEAAALTRYGALLLAARRVTPSTGWFLDGLDAVVLQLDGHLPAGERWLLLRAAARAVRGELADLELADVEAFDALAVGRADAGDVTRRGVVASRAGEHLVLCRANHVPAPWPARPVPAAGRVVIREAGIALVVGDEARSLVVQAGLRAADWVARPRRPGDRLRPAGRGGSRKVSDLLAELGVPSPLRDRVPLLEVDGRPVWLPGAPPDDDAVGPVAVGVEFCGPPMVE